MQFKRAEVTPASAQAWYAQRTCTVSLSLWKPLCSATVRLVFNFVLFDLLRNIRRSKAKSLALPFATLHMLQTNCLLSQVFELWFRDSGRCRIRTEYAFCAQFALLRLIQHRSPSKCQNGFRTTALVRNRGAERGAVLNEFKEPEQRRIKEVSLKKI